jgi:hypothetical protein
MGMQSGISHPTLPLYHEGEKCSPASENMFQTTHEYQFPFSFLDFVPDVEQQTCCEVLGFRSAVAEGILPP